MATATLDTRVTVEQRIRSDRRINDRRQFPAQGGHNGAERRQDTRRKVERRKQIDPTTCERDYSGEEIEFMNAMDTYKRRSGRPFPTWSEVLEVVRSLGYRKVEAPTELIFKS